MNNAATLPRSYSGDNVLSLQSNEKGKYMIRLTTANNKTEKAFMLSLFWRLFSLTGSIHHVNGYHLKIGFSIFTWETTLMLTQWDRNKREKKHEARYE
jgi:hypothetical protein